jgi:hypothetical protein
MMLEKGGFLTMGGLGHSLVYGANEVGSCAYEVYLFSCSERVILPWIRAINSSILKGIVHQVWKVPGVYK